MRPRLLILACVAFVFAALTLVPAGHAAAAEPAAETPTARDTSSAGFSGWATREAVEDQGRRWVVALNTDDRKVRGPMFDTFYSEVYLRAMEDEYRMHRQIETVRDKVGRLEFHRADASVQGEGEERRATLHVYAKSKKDGRWRDLQFVLDPLPPHRIRALLAYPKIDGPPPPRGGER